MIPGLTDSRNPEIRLSARNGRAALPSFFRHSRKGAPQSSIPHGSEIYNGAVWVEKFIQRLKEWRRFTGATDKT